MIIDNLSLYQINVLFFLIVFLIISHVLIFSNYFYAKSDSMVYANFVTYFWGKCSKLMLLLSMY